MREISLMLDKKQFTRKPSNECDTHVDWTDKPLSEIILISIRLNKGHTQVNPKILAEACVNGQSMCLGYFGAPDPRDNKIHRRNNCWTKQDAFGLDFDHDLTIEEFLQRCEKLDLYPAFVYTTFSHSPEHHKFRAIFVSNQTVTDYRVRYLMQYTLMKLFPEADSKCIDAARLFFGGRQIVYENYDAEIDLLDIVRTYCITEEERDSINVRRNLHRYCQLTGLNLHNGFPHVEECDEILEENSPTSILYYYRGCGEFFKKCFLIHFSISEKEFKRVIPCLDDDEDFKKTNKNKTGGRPKSTKVTKFDVMSSKSKRELERNFDFESLNENCQLFKEFLSGQRWCYHYEIFGIATNLLCVEGGESKLFEGLESREEYAEKDWAAQVKYLKAYQYSPTRCENFCPHKDSCEHNFNMLQQVDNKRGQVRCIETIAAKSLEDAESDLHSFFTRAMNSTDKKVHVIKAPTGIGKTKLYSQSNLDGVMILVPRHDLLNEVAATLDEQGVDYVKAIKRPTLDNPEKERLIQKYISLDLLQEAREVFESYVMAAQHKISKGQPISAAEKQSIEYATMQETINTAKTILATHEKMLYINNKNIDTCIIDEDIMSSSIFVSGKAQVNDFHLLRSHIASCRTLKASDKKNLDELLNTIITDLTNSRIHRIYDLPMYALKTNLIKTVIKENVHAYSTNILEFLDCDYYIKLSDGSLDYKTSRLNKVFKPDLKYLVLTATASEKLYTMLLKDRLEFKDVGIVKSRGRILQYTEKSCSRSSLYDCNNKPSEKVLKYIKEKAGELPVISYKLCFDNKEFKTKLNDLGINVAAYFGATSGLNTFKGKDIAVVGTPHMTQNEYLLIASCLGYEIKCSEQEEIGYRSIIRNGYEFWFPTYESEVLQEIQLWLIESELIQAIGRSRALREDVVVILLSNLIVPCAEIQELRAV
jgi:hypothetical protein